MAAKVIRFIWEHIIWDYLRPIAITGGLGVAVAFLAWLQGKQLLDMAVYGIAVWCVAYLAIVWTRVGLTYLKYRLWEDAIRFTGAQLVRDALNIPTAYVHIHTVTARANNFDSSGIIEFLFIGVSSLPFKANIQRTEGHVVLSGREFPRNLEPPAGNSFPLPNTSFGYGESVSISLRLHADGDDRKFIHDLMEGNVPLRLDMGFVRIFAKMAQSEEFPLNLPQTVELRIT